MMSLRSTTWTPTWEMMTFLWPSKQVVSSFWASLPTCLSWQSSSPLNATSNLFISDYLLSFYSTNHLIIDPLMQPTFPPNHQKKNQLHNNHNSLAERNKKKEISWRSVKLKLCGVFCSEEIRGHSWYLKADGWFVCDNMWSPARWLPLSVLRTVDGWVRYWLTFCFPAISSACLCDRPPKRSWLPLFYCTCARSKDQREHAFGQWVPLV